MFIMKFKKIHFCTPQFTNSGRRLMTEKLPVWSKSLYNQSTKQQIQKKKIELNANTMKRSKCK